MFGSDGLTQPLDKPLKKGLLVRLVRSIYSSYSVQKSLPSPLARF